MLTWMTQKACNHSALTQNYLCQATWAYKVQKSFLLWMTATAANTLYWTATYKRQLFITQFWSSKYSQTEKKETPLFSMLCSMLPHTVNQFHWKWKHLRKFFKLQILFQLSTYKNALLYMEERELLSVSDDRLGWCIPRIAHGGFEKWMYLP